MQSLRKVKFTNLEKILYPSLGVSKYQVIAYYIQSAPRILDFLADRAVTMYRFPNGIDEEGFYEKNVPEGKPFWVRTFSKFSETAMHDIEYVVCNDVETLAWLANLAALEIHIPLSKTNSHEKPDLVLFDVDPEPPADFDDAVVATLLLREKLNLLGLEPYVKTSGKKGLHVVLPIEPKYTFRETRAFAHQMGRFLAKESDMVVSEIRQSKVPGTVFVDYMQNIHFKTMICPYGLRAEENATVSTPLDWREVKKGLKPEELNILTVPKRTTNPWNGLFAHKQSLDFEDILAKERKSVSERSSALKGYIQKRDFTKTGEPSRSSIREGGNTFVVQEHHARRLHYDFRLAREGVLKSWAVPKGIPETPRTRRLAIETEDHPLEYSEFEGTIPKGQYGAGAVRIWDKGSYELKIWTEDKIEFFLKGKRLNGMYVLVKLKKLGPKSRKQKEWLLMKMK